MPVSPAVPAVHGAPIAMPEFVALIAALMALGALGIDAMLPALPAIGTALDVASANARQYVITAFLAGFGIAQLIHGPLSDRFGRRQTLIVSLAAYAVVNMLCAISGSFTLLLIARVLAGALIAATRVSTVAIVRDCYSGRAMARVMSITFIVFMIVPVLAPAFGAAVLLIGNWRDIFWAVALVTLTVLGWFAWRMPETMAAEDRRPLSLTRTMAGWRKTVSDRYSLGYTLATACLMGPLYGYLNSVQQIMADTFARPDLLVVIFATTAGTMALANVFNATLVMRLGTRWISHSAILALIVTSAVHLLLVLLGHETLLTFAVLQALTLGFFGLAASNFSAMAMNAMGHIAGTAASVQGFASVTGGAALGAIIGQAFDGTTVPLSLGFLLAGLVALTLVAVTERGRLFRPA